MEITDLEIEDYVDKLKDESEVNLIGKGKNISKAVDVAENLKLKGMKIESINIETEEKDNKRISVIKIKMVKG